MPSDSIKATSTIDTSIADADACKMKVMEWHRKKNQKVLEGGRSEKEKRRKISLATLAAAAFDHGGAKQPLQQSHRGDMDDNGGFHSAARPPFVVCGLIYVSAVTSSAEA